MESCDKYLLNAYCVPVTEAYYTDPRQGHTEMGMMQTEDTLSAHS